MGLSVWERRPLVKQAAILAAFNSLIVMIVALGLVNWNLDQQTAVMVFGSNLLIVSVQLIGALFTEGYTTPLVDARDEDGMELTREDNSPTLRKQAKINGN